MSVANPNECCSVDVACCDSGKAVPTQLIATVNTGCGEYTFGLGLETVEEGSGVYVWKGNGSYECKPDPASPCRSFSITMSVTCSGTNWSYSGPCNGSSPTFSCPPFFMEVQCGGGCVGGMDICITETAK